MRFARTTIIYFLTQVGITIAGFIGTVYFAQELGAAVLGTYFVVVALVSWGSIPIEGIASGVNKRVSEGADQDEFFTAGLVLCSILAAGIALLTLLFRAQVEAYVGAPVASLLALLLVIEVGYLVAKRSLQGERQVERAGQIEFIERLARLTIQVGLVLVGYRVVGLIAGHGAAYVVAILAGLVYLRSSLARFSWEHVHSLARFGAPKSIGFLSNRAYASLDTVLLAAFVTSSLVGIYEVAWRLGSVLSLISLSIQTTIFPEVSALSSEDEFEEVRNLLREALTFTGVISIPGLFGAVVLGPSVLAVYGEEFQRGATVLVVLIVAIILKDFGSTFVNIINGLDRPKVGMSINLAFVVTNGVLNVLFIRAYGIFGAAVATAVSAGMVLFLGYYAVHRLLGPVGLPLSEFAKQVLAASVMAVLTWVLQESVAGATPYVTVALVCVGAGVYGILLFGLSKKVREKTVEVAPSLGTVTGSE
jgi:O-antigen/teichoic acid export membrane protein